MTKQEAFAEVMDLNPFCVGIYRDKKGSTVAGYDIYRSSFNWHCYVCDLGDRLEVNRDHTPTFSILYK